jgi:hypothetical protein
MNFARRGVLTLVQSDETPIQKKAPMPAGRMDEVQTKVRKQEVRPSSDTEDESQRTPLRIISNAISEVTPVPSCFAALQTI